MMLIGENSRVVVDRVKTQMAEIQKTLPEGVKIVAFYDRADLIRRTIHTVTHNLIEGAILVVVVLFLFLGDFRASLIVGSVIPLSMLVAFMGMTWAGVSGNLMSLGAIDFGLIVDGSVVMIENIFRRLSQPDGHGGSVSHRTSTPAAKCCVRLCSRSESSSSCICRSLPSRTSKERCSGRWR